MVMAKKGLTAPSRSSICLQNKQNQIVWKIFKQTLFNSCDMQWRFFPNKNGKRMKINEQTQTAYKC